MELLAPVLVLAAIVVLLRLLVRSWPEGSRLGGFEVWWRRDGSRDGSAAGDAGPDARPTTEDDDDVRWHWTHGDGDTTPTEDSDRR